MMTETELDKYVGEAKPSVTWTVTNLKLVSLPRFNTQTRTSTLAIAYAADLSNGLERHTALVSYVDDGTAPVFVVMCSDKFLDKGGLSAADANTRCVEAVKAVDADVALAATLMAHHDTYPQSDSCEFALNWRRTNTLCEHTEAFLAHLRQTKPDFKAELVAGFENLLTANSAIAAASGDVLTIEELAFKVPVLFEGDRGAGKTVTARAFARTNGYSKVEMPGHDGVEAMDLLGYSLPAPNGAMVWKDGPLSEAFRKARKGKTVLIIDELCRIPMRQLSILLTAFSPDEGMYRLRTGRILSVEDGVATEEELECPVSNLCVIATTNVGSEYAVDEMDPALAERFVVLRLDTSESELKRILTIVAKLHGLKVAVVPKCITFYKTMLEARSRGLIARIPTTRTLARALELAGTEAGVRKALKTQALLWVARTGEGQPVPEQLKLVDTTLTKIFK